MSSGRGPVDYALCELRRQSSAFAIVRVVFNPREDLRSEVKVDPMRTNNYRGNCSELHGLIDRQRLERSRNVLASKLRYDLL